MPRIFNSKSDRIIIDGMRKWGHHKDCYARISKLIPSFTAKQICQHWNYKLDPRLNKCPFSDEEREYIDNWVKNNRIEDGFISWKRCQQDMETVFGKLHSTNKIKNAWNSKQHRFGPATIEPKFQPQFKRPDMMKPIF